MSIIIEKARPSDAEEMIAYLRQIGSETDNLTFGAEGLPITVEDEKKYIAQLENSTDNVMLVAKIDGKIIGNASLTRLARRMSHRGNFCVSVFKEHWGKGIGGQLLNKIIEFAKENSFDIIELQVRSDNLRAVRLYERYGFRKICTYPAFFKLGDQLIDCDFMCLYLN